MDLNKKLTCLEFAKPYCGEVCPFGVDVISFMEKAQRGAIKAAFREYRNAVGFPRIVSSLCTQPCKVVCPRGNHGGAVEMRLLEKSSIILTTDTSMTEYNLPNKEKRIAIVGAGTGGLFALQKLNIKNYTVDIFERTDNTGGYLRTLLEDDLLDEDFNEQLRFDKCNFYFNHTITDRGQLEEYDAVLICTGEGSEGLNLFNKKSHEADWLYEEIDGTGYFAIGGLLGQSLIQTMANGIKMGNIIESYLKTGSPKHGDNKSGCVLKKGLVEINDFQENIRKVGECYTKEEFIHEAKRCVKCSCSLCQTHCDLCQYLDKRPGRIKSDISATILEGTTEIKATPAKRYMSLCNQCGLCKEFCPEKIDLDKMFMEGRYKLFKQGKMPWAFHEYYRKDMNQANTEADLLRIPINEKTGNPYETCDYAFFPGCQLGASEPILVEKTYEYLQEKYPDTAIFLQCCGIAADWEGDIDAFKDVLEDIKNKWRSIGCPIMILACMTCYKKFKEYLPEIPIKSLYEIIQEEYFYNKKITGVYSIFHPCAANGNNKVQQAVSNIANQMGLTVYPLKESEYAKCCGYGGHGEIADKEYTRHVAQKRSEETPYPFITYCINCRDIFRTTQKSAMHILELLFLSDKKTNHVPTVTERWQNRFVLKQNLLKKYWNIECQEKDEMFGLELVINSSVKEKMNQRHIFEQEIAQVIDFCERTERTFINEENGSHIGYCHIGYMTYWVEYKMLDKSKGVCEIVNVYSHRVKIDLEEVWHGVKRKAEM